MEELTYATCHTIANGTGRIESEVAVVKADVRERIDLAAHRMETNARVTALEARP